jgi:hypothetical protein
MISPPACETIGGELGPEKDNLFCDIRRGGGGTGGGTKSAGISSGRGGRSMSIGL